MARACMYCGRHANSKEHIIASQIIEILKADPRGFPLPTNLKLSHRFGGPIVRTKKGKPGGTKSKPTLEFTLDVCAICNNGWMNEVDRAALPYLADMIRGRTIALNSSAQTQVAAWMAKIAVTSRPVHLRFGPHKVPAPLEKAWTDWLYTNHTAPLGWYVWLARYDGAEPLVYSGDDVRVEDPVEIRGRYRTVLAAHGVYATIVMGYLGIQLLGIDGPLALPLDLNRAPDYVVRIWPASPAAVAWPPPRSYDDGNLDAFISRLKG
jgi:hypothetical protein